MIKQRCSTCTYFDEDFGVCLDISKLIFDFSNNSFTGHSEPIKISKDSWCSNYLVDHRLQDDH